MANSSEEKEDLLRQEIAKATVNLQKMRDGDVSSTPFSNRGVPRARVQMKAMIREEEERLAKLKGEFQAQISSSLR